MNLCKDCKHYESPLILGPSCRRKERVIGIDPITGRNITSDWKPAREERGEFQLFAWPWQCGRKGKFFERKETK